MIPLAGDGHESRLGRMLVLMVASACTRQLPPVLLQQANDLANLHSSKDMPRHPSSQPVHINYHLTIRYHHVKIIMVVYRLRARRPPRVHTGAPHVLATIC